MTTTLLCNAGNSWFDHDRPFSRKRKLKPLWLPALLLLGMALQLLGILQYAGPADPGSTAGSFTPAGSPSGPDNNRHKGPKTASALAAMAATSSQLPHSGRLHFLVTRGDGNFVLAQSTHEWKLDGSKYHLKSTTATVGVVALFRPGKIVQTSEGSVDAQGLKPHAFRNEKSGGADTANFDWAANRLTQGSGVRVQALKAGAQDALSLFYQLALLPLQGKEVKIWVATGKKFVPYSFEIVGEEMLSLKPGKLRTLHLRTHDSGSDNTEIWLALDYSRLPVKIRYTDKKHDVYNQVADAIDIERKTP